VDLFLWVFSLLRAGLRLLASHAVKSPAFFFFSRIVLFPPFKLKHQAAAWTLILFDFTFLYGYLASGVADLLDKSACSASVTEVTILQQMMWCVGCLNATLPL